MTWFDATQVDPSQGAQSFPVGRWPVVATASAKTATKDNSGGMLVLTLTIIDGPHKGFAGPYRLNLWNTSDQAKEIAGKQLSALCHVTGVYKLADQVNMCSELFGKPFVIAVELQTKGEGAEKGYTQISGVYDMQGNPPAKQQGAAPQQQQPPMQQPPQPGWQGGAPQGQQPQQGGQPSWQPPQQGGAPMQPQQQGQPQWQGGGQPQQPAPQQQPQWQPQQQQPPAQQPQQQGQPQWAPNPAGAAPAPQWGPR